MTGPTYGALCQIYNHHKIRKIILQFVFYHGTYGTVLHTQNATQTPYLHHFTRSLVHCNKIDDDSEEIVENDFYDQDDDVMQ